jgi:hypothetical protein
MLLDATDLVDARPSAPAPVFPPDGLWLLDVAAAPGPRRPSADRRCRRRLARCQCSLADGHPTGHVYVHASSAPDRKAG